MEEELKEGAEQLGIELSDAMIEKFKVYYKELLLWNKKMNLISRGDEGVVVRRHFLDSLEVAQFIPVGASVLDVGSGAGFPGIPIKIVRDDIKLDLLEPKLKRFEFLNHLTNTLSLECSSVLEVGIYRYRIEDFKIVGTSRRLVPTPVDLPVYDCVLARSVGKIKWITKATEPILADDGRIITYKGSRFWDEFNELVDSDTSESRNWEIEQRKPRAFCAGIIVVLKRQ